MARFGEVIGRWWAAWGAIVRREVPEVSRTGDGSDDLRADGPFDRERWEQVYYEQALELARLRELNRLLDRVTTERRRMHHHRPRRQRAIAPSRRA